MPTQASAWHAHATQRIAAGTAGPRSVPTHMEWCTKPGHGPGADLLGTDLGGNRILELGCGPGHNAAHLAVHQEARVTGVDLVRLQILRARSHYGPLRNLDFVAGHALPYLNASEEQFDAIYSVFGAIGLVAPQLVLPAIAERLAPGRVLAFSVPHPRRGGRSTANDDKPRRDHVTLPDRTRLSIARWELTADRWTKHLDQTGFRLTSTEEHYDSGVCRWPTTLLIRAHKL
ncbi:class I SAM-dependent methyltransferase [Nocardioides sp. NPDC057577]|uniref:class I SAM-dependent methyltransferase n=1 Tax=Nocardioides sp. NPDC057577 TaxID=3346171 RepID=UPI00366D81D0